jgi:hypothetical protein
MTNPEHIIFIHGLADITKQWRRATPFLEDQGFNVHFFDYPTLSNNLDVPAIVSRLQTFIHECIGSSSFQIFAHSQGGLIAEWFDLFISDAGLKRVITIGTPYQGNSLPLYLPPNFLKKLPVSRKQIEDLSYMSPVLCALLQKRIEKNLSVTNYVSLISHSKNVLNIESDGVVSVCSGNRDANYYIADGHDITVIKATGKTLSAFVNTGHLPLRIVHKLLRDRGANAFAQLLLSALKGEPLCPYGRFFPTQTGLIVPLGFENMLQLPDGAKKINSRPTLDGKYQVLSLTLSDADQFVTFFKQSIQLTAGKFTYVLEPSFFNTGTSVYASH